MEPDELHLLIDSLSEGVYVVAPDWRIIAFNRAAEVYFGVPREAVLGRSCLEAIRPAAGAPVEQAIREAFAGAPEQRFEFASTAVPGRTVAVTVNRTGAGNVFLVFADRTEDLALRQAMEDALSSSEARLALATRAAALGVWEWRPGRQEMIFSDLARLIWGIGPDEPVTLEALRARTHPDDEAAVAAQLARALDADTRDTAPLEYRIVRPDGEVRWIRVYGAVVFGEAAGAPEPLRYAGTIEDVTERKRTEEQLRASEASVRLAVGAGRMAVWAVDGEGRLAATEELNRLMGFAAGAKPTLDEVQARYFPGERRRVGEIAARTVAEGRRFFEAECRFVRADDGMVRWMVLRAEAQFDGGAPNGWIGVAFDTTERKQAEERLQLLAREVDHRANNLLTIVQGAIALTKGDSVAAYKQALLGRVAALARAHQLLAASRWLGADLRRILEEELRPYGLEETARIVLEGEHLALRPAVAQSLALAIHELTTNAVKYGSLSTALGRLHVGWTPVEGGFALVWTEAGGPPVSVPTRQGVGALVLDRSIVAGLAGRATFDWRPEGLVCRLEVPLD